MIGRCLDSVLKGFSAGEVEIVVACNGCTDGTADVVRAKGSPSIKIIETEIASKTEALRLGEEVLSGFPRIYLDADVVLPSDSARLMLTRLREGPASAARPPVYFDSSRSTAVVRAFYRARSRIPKLVESLWGAGVYALSAPGRARFGLYPDVIADDLFVDQCFARSDIEIVGSAPVIVMVPRRTKDLLLILRRTYRGNKENRDSVSGTEGTAPSTARELLKAALRGPAQATDVSVYMTLVISARLLLAFSAGTSWERDQSSRADVP